MDSLFLLQFGCFIITIFFALLLSLSRMLVKWVNDKYERSRWYLTSSMVILAIHFLLQMLFGFRASGDDIGATINILFYSPAAFLISYSLINIECGKKSRYIYILTGIFGYICILGVFLVGLLVYGSLHMPNALLVMRGLFFICILFFIFAPIHEVRRLYAQIQKVTGGDLKSYKMYLGSGYISLSITALMLSIAMLSNEILFYLAPVFFISFFLFCLSYVALGFNIPIIEESEAIEMAEITESDDKSILPAEEQLSPKLVREIEEKLGEWCKSGLFKDSDLTLSGVSTRVGLSRNVLTRYFAQERNCNFRGWLSGIRLIEAQRLLLEHPEYSNDAISQECGFSSRGQLYNIFRDKTGMSPGEWRDKQNLIK